MRALSILCRTAADVSLVRSGSTIIFEGIGNTMMAADYNFQTEVDAE
ncbi:MAG TPA: hypothetical protein H9671_10700 [Firmicutes bacterium]|nr:hypothetical protein [Bacillota bacterium]